MTGLADVQAFLGRYGTQYQELAKEVQQACANLQKGPTASRVLRVYSRSDKQDGHGLKAPAKILEKAKKPVTDISIRAVNDIVGVTVVAYYPDDIDVLIGRLRELIQGSRLNIVGKPDKKETGYFGTHLTIRAPNHCLCEVQFKTVLHDAWSAKMHDLTYKPQGSIDNRMPNLMTAIGYSLEGIEKQSVTIRDMIAGRYALQSNAFKAHCDLMLRPLGEKSLMTALGDPGPDAVQLFNKIESARQTTLTHDARANAEALAGEIDSLCDQGPNVRWGWLLMSRLACGAALHDLAQETNVQVDKFLQYLEEHEPSLAAADVLHYVPLSLYAAGDFVLAVDYCDKLLNSAMGSKLDLSDRRQIEFNKYTFMLEQEHLRPCRYPEDREALRKQLEDALFSDWSTTDARFTSAILDSQGLFKIVFGKDKADVRVGITECSRSAELAPPAETTLAAACLEWRLEAGWRRYFDLVERVN